MVVLVAVALSGCSAVDAGFDCPVNKNAAQGAAAAPESPPPDFYHAAQDGDVRSIRKYIASGFDLDAADAEVLLRAEDGYEVRSGHATALILAANGGHFDVAEALVCAGANVNANTDAGDTALLRATERGDERLARALLAHGADTTAQPTGLVGAALHTASGMGYIGIVRALLDAGANPNAIGPAGITPLQLAVNEGKHRVVELLLERGASPNPRNEAHFTTALHVAAKNGDKTAVRLLLSHGADPNTLNNEGSTPLLEAVAEGSRPVTELLLKHGADPNIRNYHLDSPLGWAVFNDNAALVRTLLDNGANPSLEDRDHDTALVFAKSEEVRELLRRATAASSVLTISAGARSIEILKLVQDTDYLAGEVEADQLREGWLAPADYTFAHGAERAEIVAMMVTRQEGRLGGVWDYRNPDVPLVTPAELLTLASLVQSEAPEQQFFDLVASVFVNRLRRGMHLQSDAALIYGITGGDRSLDRSLRKSDLEEDTPWNTYIHTGLPPTPICSPSLAAIASAGRAPATDYLYFAPDASGGLAFAATLREHNENLARYRDLMRTNDEH